jgi:hypothetical protein
MGHRWKRITADWKLILFISILLFVPLMWLGISRGYSDLWLYAIAMALGSWHVSEFAVVGYRRLRGARSKERHSGSLSAWTRR